jgi:UPF0271 protein
MIILSQMTRISVDINADLGEGAGQDDAIMPLISSCNIACGGHIGDEESINKTIVLAQFNKVKIGAHPSFPDKENFGRTAMEMTEVDLEESLKNQLTLFYQIAKENDEPVHHIKAHGALYNSIAKEEKTAAIFLNAVSKLDVKAKLYVPNNSVIHRLAKSKYECLTEAFIDRAYNEDSSLVERSQKGALHKTPEAVWKQLHEMITNKKVNTINGAKIEVQADTFCIHGDHPNAKQILEYIHQMLSKHNLSLKK